MLAHQGGWDEALFVAVPLALFAVVVWVAKRRAEAEVQPGPGAEDGVGTEQQTDER